MPASNSLKIRERTLVLLAASTGLRQSEMFGLRWGDTDFAQGSMFVIRSVVYGVVGPCKTESSQKPVFRVQAAERHWARNPSRLISLDSSVNVHCRKQSRSRRRLALGDKA